VIFAAQLGAFMLLGSLAVAVTLAQILVLLLLAFAPVALVAGVLPGRGHDLFIGWLSRLAAFLIRKALYSLILAVLLAVASALGQATAPLGWLMAFGLQGAFFWAVLLYRRQLLGQLTHATTGPRPGRDPGQLPRPWRHHARHHPPHRQPAAPTPTAVTDARRRPPPASPELPGTTTPPPMPPTSPAPGHAAEDPATPKAATPVGSRSSTGAPDAHALAAPGADPAPPPGGEQRPATIRPAASAPGDEAAPPDDAVGRPADPGAHPQPPGALSDPAITPAPPALEPLAPPRPLTAGSSTTPEPTVVAPRAGESPLARQLRDEQQRLAPPPSAGRDRPDGEDRADREPGS
jgi:hypothetical protein